MNKLHILHAPPVHYHIATNIRIKQIYSENHVLPGVSLPGRYQCNRPGLKGVSDRGPIQHTSAVMGACPLILRQRNGKDQTPVRGSTKFDDSHY